MVGDVSRDRRRAQCLDLRHRLDRVGVTPPTEKGPYLRPSSEAGRQRRSRSAAAWLIERALPDEARWTEYPPDQTHERGNEYLAVSALVIHVAAHRGGIKANSMRCGSSNLPQAVPTPLQSEMAKGYVFRSKTQFTLDDVRHYRFPWMLTHDGRRLRQRERHAEGACRARGSRKRCAGL